MYMERCSRDSRFTRHAVYIAAPIYTVCIRVLRQMQFARVSANVTFSHARAPARTALSRLYQFARSLSLSLSFAKGADAVPWIIN